MIVVDKQSRTPVYEQIKTQILTLINLGIYPADSKLPSIRQISSDTGVNVNTVKKAFYDLELSGIIYTVPGTGSFVSEFAFGNTAVKEKAKKEIMNALDVAKSIGISKAEAEEILSAVYKE